MREWQHLHITCSPNKRLKILTFSSNKTWVLVFYVALFNNTVQHSNFSQAPASVNHLLLMAHQTCARWFTGKHRACHQAVHPALQQQRPCGAHRLSRLTPSPVNQPLLDGGDSAGSYLHLFKGASCSRAGWTIRTLAFCQGCCRTQPRCSIHHGRLCTPTQEEQRVCFCCPQYASLGDVCVWEGV